MAALNQKITRKVRGDDIPVVRRYVDLPAGDPIIKARLTVKATESPSDPGVFALLITTVNNAAGIISDGTTPEIVLQFLISKVNSLLLTAGTTYYYDIQVTSTGGYDYTCEKGTIKLEQQITQAAG